LLQWNRDHAILGVEWGLHPQAPNPLHPLVSLAWSSST
jgi:hypothetical protein